jgi:hypothetical protein
MKAILFWLTDAEAEALCAGSSEALDVLEGAARDTCARVRCDVRLVHGGQYLADVMYDATGCSNIVLPERRRCYDHLKRPATHVDTIGVSWCRVCAHRLVNAGHRMARRLSPTGNCKRCPHSTIIHDQEGCPVEGCNCCVDENGTPPAEGM